jgi:hypothetical protein
VHLTVQEIEQRLADLAQSVPRLLKQNRGVEFWIEFLDRADAIRNHVALEHYGWVTERIYETLAAYGISTPTRWILAAAAQANGPDSRESLADR